MEIPRPGQPPLRLANLTAGDPRWEAARLAIRDLITQGDLASLETLAQTSARPDLNILVQQAWRGRVFAGEQGARAFLESVDRPPPCETASPRRLGVLLGFAQPSEVLATLVAHATTARRAEVLASAIQERVLRDGSVRHPAIRAWDNPLPLMAHPWEEDLLQPVPDAFVHDTLGNWYFRRRDDPRWPEGTPVDPPGAAVVVHRVWDLDEEWDPRWPKNEAPPSGPLVADELYPNGTTWCLEATAPSIDDAMHLGAWPFPTEHLSLAELAAEPTSARLLLREWLWRGLVGGAYGQGSATAARTHAWRSLAMLSGIEAPLTDAGFHEIAEAASDLRVGGFRSRGPSIEALGGDLGIVAVRKTEFGTYRAFAMAHTDTD
ncbi:MAG: DUF6183 family protein [Myxococcota bacterium]